RVSREGAFGQAVLEGVEDQVDRLDEVEVELALDQIASRLPDRLRLVLDVLRRLPGRAGRRDRILMLASEVQCCPDTVRSRLALVRRAVQVALDR
ncbi:MAG: hypothetical protein FD129_2764, partial [bacterium]